MELSDLNRSERAQVLNFTSNSSVGRLRRSFPNHGSRARDDNTRRSEKALVAASVSVANRGIDKT
jgi:hypothetical protein